MKRQRSSVRIATKKLSMAGYMGLLVDDVRDLLLTSYLAPPEAVVFSLTSRAHHAVVAELMLAKRIDSHVRCAHVWHNINSSMAYVFAGYGPRLDIYGATSSWNHANMQCVVAVAKDGGPSMARRLERYVIDNTINHVTCVTGLATNASRANMGTICEAALRVATDSATTNIERLQNFVSCAISGDNVNVLDDLIGHFPAICLQPSVFTAWKFAAINKPRCFAYFEEKYPTMPGTPERTRLVDRVDEICETPAVFQWLADRGYAPNPESLMENALYDNNVVVFAYAIERLPAARTNDTLWLFLMVFNTHAVDCLNHLRTVLQRPWPPGWANVDLQPFESLIVAAGLRLGMPVSTSFDDRLRLLEILYNAEIGAVDKTRDIVNIIASFTDKELTTFIVRQARIANRQGYTDFFKQTLETAFEQRSGQQRH
jgi:hypothetical protein